MSTTVRRKDISLSEQRQSDNTIYGAEEWTTGWEAHLDGRLSTGEWVEMYRTAKSAGEALLLLTEDIEANGWSIK